MPAFFSKKKNKKIINKSKKTKKQTNTIKEPDVKLCNTCFKIKNINGNFFSESVESWKDFPFHLPVLGRKTGTQEVKLDFSKANGNKLVYYFGSKAKHSNLHSKYPNAYKDSKNTGLVKLDDNGCATINLDCPQPYIDNNYATNSKNTLSRRTYISHIHMLLSNKNMTTWSDKLYTQNILCCVDKKFVSKSIKNNSHLIINALSKDYFEKNSIPTSHNLYYKDAQKMTKQQVVDCVKKMIYNSPDLYKNIKNNKLCIQNTPIIVYCYSKTCNAGHQLSEVLHTAGFTNVVDYKDGILGWMGRN